MASALKFKEPKLPNEHQKAKSGSSVWERKNFLFFKPIVNPDLKSSQLEIFSVLMMFNFSPSDSFQV